MISNGDCNKEGAYMNQVNIQCYKTKIGELILGSFDNQLCILDYRYRKMRATVDNRIKRGLSAEFVEKDDSLLQKTRMQIETIGINIITIKSRIS